MKCYWGIACLLLLCRTLSLDAQTAEDSLQMVQWYQQGVKLKRAQNYDSSKIYFDLTHQFARQNQWWLHFIKVEKQYARYLRDLDQRPFAAISKLDSMIPLAEERLGPIVSETGELYETRANTYNFIGQHSLALQDYVKSLSIRRQVFGNTHQRVAASYLNMAPLFLRNQQPQKAIRYAQLGADLLSQEKRYPIYFLANAYVLQGRAYDQLGDYAKAEALFEQAYQVMASNDLLEKSAAFSLYLHQMRVNLHSEQYAKAASYLAQAKRFAKRNLKAEDPNLIRIDIMEAELALKKEDFAAAEKAVLSAKERYNTKAEDQGSRLALLYNMLGQIKFEQKSWENAQNYFNMSLRLLCPGWDQKADGIFPSPGTNTYSPSSLITVLYNQALSFHHEGLDKGDIALWVKSADILNTCMQWISYTRSALQEPEDRSNLTKFRYRVYELAMQNAWSLTQADEDPKWKALSFEIAERSRANLLWESLQTDQLQNPTALPAAFIRQQTRLESGISIARNNWFSAWQADADNPKLIELQNEIARLQLSQDSLQYIISLQYPNYHVLKYRHEVPSLVTIQQQLEPQTVLLEYFYTDTLLYLVEIRNTTSQIYRFRLSDDFVQILDSWQEHLQNPALTSAIELENIAHQVYAQIIPQHLLTDTIQSLLVIPDGPLTKVPFELLCSESKDVMDYRALSYLLKRFNVRYAYAAWTLLEKTDAQTTDKYWGGFAPSYQSAGPNDQLASRGPDDQSASLSGAEAEVLQIAKQMQGDSYMGQRASKANFLKQANAFKVLHLALHAYTLEDRPLYSGLIFGEAGKQDTLLLHEIYPLHLKSEMTVLSACNTGVGQSIKGEGSLSLAHAFAYAGCPSVVMSLWPVNDQSTQDLMEAFYEELKLEQSKSIAMQKARLRYLEEHDLTHPYYWGAFVTIGDDTPISPPLGMAETLGRLTGYLLLAYLFYLLIGRFRKKNRSSVD